MITCRKLSSFADSLRSIRKTSNSCIVSCLTNFLTDVSSRSATPVQSRVEPVLEDIKTVLVEFSEMNPDVMMLVAPPMFRLQPEWYHDNLPEIVLHFSRVLCTLQSDGLRLLPTFSGLELEDDLQRLRPLPLPAHPTVSCF